MDSYDGYFWSNNNFKETNEFLIRYKDAIEFSIALPSYAGELLIRVKDGFGDLFKNEGSGSEVLVDQYDASYYLQDCGGHESFSRNGLRPLVIPEYFRSFVGIIG